MTAWLATAGAEWLFKIVGFMGLAVAFLWNSNRRVIADNSRKVAEAYRDTAQRANHAGLDDGLPARERLRRLGIDTTSP